MRKRPLRSRGSDVLRYPLRAVSKSVGRGIKSASILS